MAIPFRKTVGLQRRGIVRSRAAWAELQVATVRAQVLLSLFTDFETMRTFKPAELQERAL